MFFFETIFIKFSCLLNDNQNALKIQKINFLLLLEIILF